MSVKLRPVEPASLLWWLLIAVLVLLVVHPLARLLIGSITDPTTGTLTLANFAAAYGRTRYLTALVNSLKPEVRAGLDIELSAC